MSAQYRPYRDEESVDGLEATSWSDNEPGTIQIYEKTTEELPFNSVGRRTLLIQIASFVTIGVVGFLLGYLTPTHPCPHTSPSTNTDSDSEMLDHVETYSSHEDTTIRDKLLAKIDGQNLLHILVEYQNSNRIPGADGDHQFAKHIHDLFAEYELDRTSMANYSFKTMLPEKPSVVQLLNRTNKVIYSNIEQEPYLYDDTRPFLPLSQANTTVITTNQIVYVNRGSKEDYTKLTMLGLSSTELEGKVFVIRQSFYQAHDDVILAQEMGAKAILLFPEPDLYGTSSPFPLKLPIDAAKAHPTAWSNYGDLASPNMTSFINGLESSKLGLDKESKVIIPVIPISFKTAQNILRGLSGSEAPKDWNCFDFTLYLGPVYREENSVDGRTKLNIEFYNQETMVTSTTVTGIIVGSTEPDRYVVLGSRRDSLNRGLLDSVSGSAVMLEIARVYSLMVKQGWRPRRTIIFNSFGAESLNLIGSSNWLEAHQRLLHSRAVAYINCDLVVTGNRSVSIAASPLLYQLLYSATKQVKSSTDSQDKTVYDDWETAQHVTEAATSGLHNAPENIFIDSEVKKILSDVLHGQTKSHSDNVEDSRDPSVKSYKKSATVRSRPKFRRLDLHSIYSPFFLYAGIPVVDVRYAGFKTSQSNGNSLKILEDTVPILGTKHDNMANLQAIDPHLKHHAAVAQILSEILRELSDSIFLPFNLSDYAVTLRESFSNFVGQYEHTLQKSNLDLKPLDKIIQDFTQAAIMFHHRQDLVNVKDALQVRKFNDQLMLLERSFLDSNGAPNYWERKHIILAPNDGQDDKGGFPGLIDWITLLEGDALDEFDYMLFVDILKLHYKTIVYTISNSIKIIDDVHII